MMHGSIDPTLLRGVVLTQFVADHEVEGRRLEVDPDLTVLRSLHTTTVPLADGGVLRLREEQSPIATMWTLGGPRGWPPAGGDELLVLELGDGVVTVGAIDIDDIDDDADDRCVEAILEVVDPLLADGGSADPVGVVLAVLERDRTLLDGPRSPLQDLYELAGMIQHDGRLMRWETYQEQGWM